MLTNTSPQKNWYYTPKGDAQETFNLAAHKSEKRMRINKKLKFAVQDKELHELHLKCFKNYLSLELKYGHQEIKMLCQIFNSFINPDNIRDFINISVITIYKSLINSL